MSARATHFRGRGLRGYKPRYTPCRRLLQPESGAKPEVTDEIGEVSCQRCRKAIHIAGLQALGFDAKQARRAAREAGFR